MKPAVADRICKNLLITGVLSAGILLSSLSAKASGGQYRTISVKALHDKIAAAWIGQMIGNIYGLPHENKYVAEPGP